MIARLANWCGRNIELIIWFNVVLLAISAVEEITNNNLYPAGLCAILVAVVLILRK